MKKFLNRIWAWMKRNLRSDARNFLHFFLAFTGIFLILTGIILSVLRMGMYSTTDKEISSVKGSQVQLANWGLRQFVPMDGEESGLIPNIGNSSRNKSNPNNQEEAIFNPNTYVVLYDANGKVLNSTYDHVAELIAEKNDHLNKTYVNRIGMFTIRGSDDGDPFVFRTTIIPTSLELTNGKRVAYIQVLVYVNQIQSSLASTSKIIVWTIAAFWLLSLFVAVYFSRWLVKPLQSALERQKAFVSNASHELRTPLAILQNRLQLLFQNPNGTIIEESENISASLNEVRNMRLLTSNLLDMAKQDQALKVEPEEVDQEFFVEIFKNYKILAENAGKGFRGSISVNKIMKIDPDLIKQLLTIFFDNAMKYTGEDGNVEMSVKRAGQNLEFVISDNGTGIPDKDKKNIFDRLYRVDEARTRGVGGLGLGLSLAKVIVTRMKGKIVVSDNKPRGTVFTIRIKA